MTHSPTGELWRRVERILPTVTKPGRYVGGELNQIIKDWDSVQTHFALVFPDIYDLGQSNLGIAILYDILNQREDIAAERAFSPWTDMEAAMRKEEIPLYSLENKRPLAEFDIIGVSLPYETLYTNFLNILDLSDIPIYSRDRTGHQPLILAGGQSVYNPEPVSPFVDAFLIGEGEEAVLEIVDVYQTWKETSTDRQELLIHLAGIPGIYVPSLYSVLYNEDGTILNIAPSHPSASLPIIKRIMAELPPPLTRFLVPNVETVQERVNIEIMRGCTRGCRFCHAGMVNRPIRERPIEEVLSALRAGLDQTGYDEISLLSLSSSDYSHILPLIEGLKVLLADQQVNISLPSLRIESFSDELMDELKSISPGGGFTLAPEAGTEKLRKIINKPISDERLMETVRSVYRHGWKTIKLYFMIGHPEETIEDVQAIIELSKTILQEGRRIAGGRARLNLGVSTFIPKPHTPFQWVPFEDPEIIEDKLNLLRDELRGTKIKLSWNNPQASLLEAWLSRGDRRISEVIYNAWKNGARFDAWSEHFNMAHWRLAFQQSGLDPDFYGKRIRTMDEALPWSHINTGVRREFFVSDFMKSKAEITRPDCRERCYHCGILATFRDLRVSRPNGGWKCP